METMKRSSQRRSAMESRRFWKPRPFSALSVLLMVGLLLCCHLSTSTAIAASTSSRGGRSKQGDKAGHSAKSSTSSSKPRTSNSGKQSGRKANKKGGDLPSNFYERLGVSPKATDKEIKKAYRKLAVKVCPLKHFSLLYDNENLNYPCS